MRTLAHSIALTIAVAFAAPLSAAESVAGSWITATKDGVVRIGDCGATVCGRLARFLVVPPQGADQRDVHNPDASLRSRKLLGLPILSGFREDGAVWRGTIYDPKAGKSYRSIIRRLDASRLEVKGCIGPFCQTQVWRRAD
ncbi:hypothetical protein GCM10011515_26150 [Tsuneonella deserti]|uniref:DUF2147 domain-containing protein n=1 Tax=Tsuneonella deserti TaxID=2035528 RepID=A0ABQ1SE45_9SPHN|nr:DUF2147 domain-containing protein [Tsuneonella deserti]GGE05407.1 hypothetical protein GCM10011515_26150 [Tsuneonella deserti]